MSTEISNEEPVLVINDKKYIVSELSELQKSLVQEINLVDQDIITSRRMFDRLTLAKEGYISRLQQDLEAPPPEDSDDTNEKPAT